MTTDVAATPGTGGPGTGMLADQIRVAVPDRGIPA
jgi:hypothetical protein